MKKIKTAADVPIVDKKKIDVDSTLEQNKKLSISDEITITRVKKSGKYVTLHLCNRFVHKQSQEIFFVIKFDNI